MLRKSATHAVSETKTSGISKMNDSKLVAIAMSSAEMTGSEEIGMSVSAGMKTETVTRNLEKTSWRGNMRITRHVGRESVVQMTSSCKR